MFSGNFDNENIFPVLPHCLHSYCAVMVAPSNSVAAGGQDSFSNVGGSLSIVNIHPFVRVAA